MGLTDIEVGGLLKNVARIATALEHIAAAQGNPVPERNQGPVRVPPPLDHPLRAHPTRVHTAPPVGT